MARKTVNKIFCESHQLLLGGTKVSFTQRMKAAVALMAAMTLSFAYAEEHLELSEAPVNKEFVEWVAARRNAAKTQSLRSAEKRDGEFVGGVTPDPRDMSHLRKRYEMTRSRVSQLTNDRGTIPPSWDSRSDGIISAVKDQNPYGTCWAHATIACLETTLLKNENREYDLSENNMVVRHGFYYDPADGKFDFGGNGWKSSAYLLRWDGPLLETQDPYPNDNAGIVLPPAKHVQNVRVLAGRGSDLDNDMLKQAIMRYGAVHVSYYHSDTYMKKSTSTAYYCGVSRSTNHAVTLIGWNDNYSKSNFATSPAGNGAFLVKNSWGTRWGDSGYFYVSYYDKTFARGTCFCFPNVEAPDNYDEIAQYDPLGNCSAFRSGSGDQYCANVFRASRNSQICAAGFWAEDYAMAYDIKVYVNCSSSSPTSGTLALTQSGTTDSESTGFQTVALSTPVSVNANARYAVVIRFKNVDPDVYAMAFEYPIAEYTTSATANAGESMYSRDGTTWYDLTSYKANANFCIKAYLKAEKPATTYSVKYTLNGGADGSHHPASATYGTAFYVSAPTRTGYTFAGWTVTSGLNTSTAKWGTGSSPSTAISSSSTKCKNGATGNVYFKNLTTGSSVTLTANWTPNTYSITYALNSGSHGATHPANATYDSAFSVSAPTRAGYTFAGWTVTSGLNTSTAKWGTGSSPSTAIGGTSTKCVNGTTGSVYFKNLTPTSGGKVTLTANWDAATIPLATALDNTTLTFTTGGSANWFGQSDMTHDGTDAARSGKIGDGQNTWMQTTVTGSGIISFWWYASSESERYDYLAFSIDGTEKARIGGTSGAWNQYSYLIESAGSHTLKWTYVKNGSVSRGEDAGFVDQVVWTDNIVTEVRNLGIGFVLGGELYELTLKNGGKIAFYDAWLTDAGISTSGGITTSILNAIGRNGLPRYQSYLFGFDPESTIPAEEQLKPTIEFDSAGTPIISCIPKMLNDLVTYTTLGKPSLNAADWVEVTPSNKASMRFFKVKVKLAK